MTIELLLAGRTDTEDYFSISGVFDASKLSHTPFLVFSISDERLAVKIVESARQLLDFPDATRVMGQWRGEWKSDFFQFNVGHYRAFLSEQNEPLKTATNVIKVVGPQGGLRSFSYEYTNEKGIQVSTSAYNKSEVARLEAFFAEHDIHVQTQRVK